VIRLTASALSDWWRTIKAAIADRLSFKPCLLWELKDYKARQMIERVL